MKSPPARRWALLDLVKAGVSALLLGVVRGHDKGIDRGVMHKCGLMHSDRTVTCILGTVQSGSQSAETCFHGGAWEKDLVAFPDCELSRLVVWGRQGRGTV